MKPSTAIAGFGPLILLLLTVAAGFAGDVVGVNEAAFVPQHPGQRLADFARRGVRGWKDGAMGLTAGAGDFYPLGTYTLEWDGASDVILGGGPDYVELIGEQPGQRVYRVKRHHKAGLILRCSGAQPASVSLTCDSVETDGPFTAAYIKDLSRFDVVRWMDTTNTNGSTQQEWLDRPTLRGPPEEWLAKGWPWELVIEASNRAGVDPWICVPHAASDDYVRQLGELFAELLNPERRVYVEYTNEAWNTGPAFGQSRWIADNLAEGDWSRRHHAYGRRASECWQVFREAFGRDRCRGVLAGQAAQRTVLERAVEGCRVPPDMLSCATYFNPGKEGLYEHYLEHGPDAEHAFALMRRSILETRKPWWDTHAKLAERLGLPLIAYEGGSHTAAASGPERQDDAYVEWLRVLERDPQMVGVYKLLRETWPGDGLCYFQRLAGPTKFGSWGHQWRSGDVHAPKNVALNEHLADRDEEPEPEDEPDGKHTILDIDLPDGGRGDTTDWLGRPATRYDGTNPLVIRVDKPFTGPITVDVQVARIGVQPGNDKFSGEPMVGMASVVRFKSTKHSGVMTVDFGEPAKAAMRTRHTQRVDGKVIGLQNGSTKSNAGIDCLFNDTRGRWHHIRGVFNPGDYRPERSDIDNLWAYIDDQGESIQAADQDGKLDLEFDTIEIGFGSKAFDCVLAVRALRITQGVGDSQGGIDRARSLGLTYAGGDYDDETTWPDDGRYWRDEAVVPEPEPAPEPPETEDWSEEVLRQIKAVGRVDPDQGYIEFDQPIVIHKRTGVPIDGHGFGMHPEDNKYYTWNRPEVMRGTELVYTGPPDKPAITIDSCLGITIKDLSIRCKQEGDAVVFTTSKGWGNNHHKLHNVHVYTKGEGVVCGGGESATTSADIEFYGCVFNGCAAGFATRDLQNVGYHFFGCYWYRCDWQLHLEKGGNANFFGGGANQLRKGLLKIDTLGPNLSPINYYGFRIDRSGGPDVPTFVDASAAAAGGLTVNFDGCTLVKRREDRGRDPVPLVKWPRGDAAKLTVNVRGCEIPSIGFWPHGARDHDRQYDRTAELLEALDSLGGD